MRYARGKSQLRPWKWRPQRHLYVFDRIMQCPPLLHGLSRHGSKSGEIIENDGKHVCSVVQMIDVWFFLKKQTRALKVRQFPEV